MWFGNPLEDWNLSFLFWILLIVWKGLELLVVSSVIFIFLYPFAHGSLSASYALPLHLGFASFHLLLLCIVWSNCNSLPIEISSSNLSSIHDYPEYYDLPLNCFPGFFILFYFNYFFILIWNDNNGTLRTCILFPFFFFFFKIMLYMFLICSWVLFILLLSNPFIPNL